MTFLLKSSFKGVLRFERGLLGAPHRAPLISRGLFSDSGAIPILYWCMGAWAGNLWASTRGFLSVDLSLWPSFCGWADVTGCLLLDTCGWVAVLGGPVDRFMRLGACVWEPVAGSL